MKELKDKYIRNKIDELEFGKGKDLDRRQEVNLFLIGIATIIIALIIANVSLSMHYQVPNIPVLMKGQYLFYGLLLLCLFYLLRLRKKHMEKEKYIEILYKKLNEHNPYNKMCENKKVSWWKKKN